MSPNFIGVLLEILVKARYTREDFSPSPFFPNDQ